MKKKISFVGIRTSVLQAELDRRNSLAYARNVGAELRARAKARETDKCDTCGHLLASHDPQCKALDAAGDTCDCDRFKVSIRRD